MSKKIFALCVFVAALASSCSNMMEELKPKASGPALFPLSIKDGPTFSDGLVTIVVNGEVPQSPKPKMTYKLPDGKTVELEGTVVKNADGTSTIKYDMNPVPKDLADGEIEITLEAKGYAPTKAKVDYVAPKPLDVTASDMKNPDGIVSITIKDDIPATPAPTVTYLLPDGTPIEIEGTVAQNPDGTKTLTFDLNPIPQELQGGTLPLTVTVPGYHKPTDVTVDYIPQANVDISVDGKSADFTMFNSEADGLEPPKITTNYHDNVDMETTYTANPGATVLADWEAVKEWLADPDNDGKTLTISAAATPKPDTDPTSAASTTLVITCKKDLEITSVSAGPDEPGVGEEVEAKAYAGSVEYTGKTFVWQWYAAENSTDDGEPIEGAANGKYTVGDGLYGKFIYAVATQTLPGVSPIVMPTNRLEVKPSAGMNVDVTAYSFTMAVTDLGQNKFKFTVTTDLPNPAFIWLVDAQKQAGQTSSDFTLDMGEQSYLFGWHDVEVLCVKNSTPYSARASVKKKQAQAAPDLSGATITKVSEFGARDGKIEDPTITTDMEYSTDGGITWKPVTTAGEIGGLSEGTVNVRYAATDDKATSAAADALVQTVTYSVNFASMSDGSVSADKTTVRAGDTVTLTITADAHCKFSSINAMAGVAPVELSGEGNARTFVMPKCDVTVSASFTRDKFKLTLSAGSNGSLSANPSGDIEWGTSVTVTIKPNANYVLDTFKYDGTTKNVTNNKYTFNMAAKNITVSATFKEDLVFRASKNNTVMGDIALAKGDDTKYAPYSNYNTDKSKYDSAGWTPVGVVVVKNSTRFMVGLVRGYLSWDHAMNEWKNNYGKKKIEITDAPGRKCATPVYAGTQVSSGWKLPTMNQLGMMSKYNGGYDTLNASLTIFGDEATFDTSTTWSCEVDDRWNFEAIYAWILYSESDQSDYSQTKYDGNGTPTWHGARVVHDLP